MPSYNKVLLIGNHVRDPELRVTPKGTAICQFGLAVNRSFKGENGEPREEVTFVDCEAWGKTAETIAKYFSKGKSMFAEGRLKIDQWEDKTSGQKRSKLKVVCENFQFVGGKDSDASSDRREPEPERQSNQEPPKQSGSAATEDVPFSQIRGDFW